VSSTALEQAERDRFGDHLDRQGAGVAGGIGDGGKVLDHAEEVRRLDRDAAGAVTGGIANGVGGHAAVVAWCDYDDLEPGRAGVGVEHLPVHRMHCLGQNHPSELAAFDAVGEKNGLDERGCTVVQRGVRDLHPRELAHQALKLEDGLERTLRNLGLIGRVRGEELGA